jgi:putative aminopeptidase FrvX
MFEEIKGLAEAFAVSGREQAIAQRVMELASPLGECWQDALGNVIVHRPGSGKKGMLTAHLDCAGLVATEVEQEKVRCGLLGAVEPAQWVGQQVQFAGGALGVVCADHGAKEITADSLYLDALGQPILPGDAAQLAGEVRRVQEWILAPQLANLAGCAIVLEALRRLEQTPWDLYAVFTVQKELGSRGAGAAAFAVAPEMAVVVDGVAVGDGPAAGKSEAVCGKGPVLRLMDRKAVSHPAAVALLEQAAVRANITCQRDVSQGDATDAGAIAAAGCGVQTAMLAFAVRGLHTAQERVCLGDLEQCAALLTAAFGG